MPTPPTSLPAQLYAGDTATWSRSFGDYSSADGWTLKYTIIGSTGTPYSFTAAAQADGSFLVTVDASATADWSPGRYRITEYVESGGQRFTLNNAPITIIAQLAGATGGVDMRSHARKMLDAIEAYLEARTPTTMMIIIDGKRLEHYPLPEILAMRDKYRIEVLRENQLAGGAPAPRLLVRF